MSKKRDTQGLPSMEQHLFNQSDFWDSHPYGPQTEGKYIMPGKCKNCGGRRKWVDETGICSDCTRFNTTTTTTTTTTTNEE